MVLISGIFNPLFGENVEIGEGANCEGRADGEGCNNVEDLVFHWFALLVDGVDGMNGKRVARDENEVPKSIVGIIENDRSVDVDRWSSDAVKTEQSLHF